MSHNPNRAAGTANRRTTRKYNPRAGYRRKAPAVPQGIDFGDIRHRFNTDRGWRIIYFQDDKFEVVYELIAAGNATGKIKNSQSARFVRVLAGTLYILLDGETIELRANQAFSISKDTEYTLSSSSSSDVEILLCQGSKYEDNVEVIERFTLGKREPLTTIPEKSESILRGDGAKAMQAAEEIKKRRIARQKARTPAPKKNPDGTPAGHGRAPLAGQAVTGANPQPIGPGGYEE